MIRRSTWIALSIFLLALAGTWAWTRSRENAGPSETATPAPESLWTIEADTLSGFQVRRLDGEGVVAGARDSEQGWVLTEPEAVPAQAGLVEQAMTSLLSPAPARVFTSVDLSEFGLDQPEFEITLHRESGEDKIVLIGDASPTSSGYYAMLPESETVYLLRSFVVDSVIGFIDEPPIAEPTPTPNPSETETPQAEGDG